MNLNTKSLKINKFLKTEDKVIEITEAVTGEIFWKTAFFCGKFEFNFFFFLNGLWYEPETLWLFLTFIKDYFTEKQKFRSYNLQIGLL